MKKSLILLMAAVAIPCLMMKSLSDSSAIAKDDNTSAFELSSYINKVFSKRHEKSEVDESLFDKFLKYSLLVTDKDSLSAEELELCHKIFETERTYMPYITCPYSRETIKNGTAPLRISIDNKKILAYMADATARRYAECYSYYPDINYYPFDYNYSSKSEYWCDNSGTERIISDYDLNLGPVYEKYYDEKPDLMEHDKYVELCWDGPDLIENDDSYMYTGKINGYRFKDLLYPQTIASGIWKYQLLEDGTAYIVGCNLPKYSEAEPIEEPVLLPSELDGHEVCGIENALTETGITKLVIPESYKHIGIMANMNYLKEVNINSPDLNLRSCFLSCPNLESVSLNVKSIEGKLFFDCDNLKSIAIKGTDGIACDAFSELPSLSEVTLPENLRYIGQDAFSNTSVTELVIPKNVEIVGALKNPYIYNGELIDPLTSDCIKIADKDCVIKSYYDTEAHHYAIANGYRFSPLDDIQYGDVNDDGLFNISDVVVLQKWLLSMPDIQLTNWKAADVCTDGRLDVFDLCLMKRELIDITNNS